MNYRRLAETGLALNLLLLFAAMPAAAQVPVDEDGEVIGAYEPGIIEESTGNEDIPLLSTADLEELVGPIALYPDDLLAIVLPAAAYPLQIMEAARFLEELENDATLKPDPDWDDSVVALINYPEVVELLNEDIDWTWRLGEAVVAQQGDVVGAIETFRDRAYAAGNLKSDSYQNVTRDEGVIEITPVSEDVIYVPYYEPERVVVYQPRPVYYYYPRAYPVYYYPYSSAHAFDRGYFWGVTTAFTIGWYTDSLNVFHHSYHGHPYYGRHYRDRWWYRRPSINIYNTNYYRRSTNVSVNRYYRGDRWRPRHNRRDYVRDVQVTRNRLGRNVRVNNTRSQRTTNVTRNTNVVRNANATRATSERRASNLRRSSNRSERQERRNANSERREPITFRERPQTVAMNRQPSQVNQSQNRGKRNFAARSQPTPTVRQATPQRRQAAPAPTVRRPAPATTETRRSERRRNEAASQPRRSAAPRQSQQRRSEAPRQSQQRRSEAPRQSQQRRSEPARKAESKRGSAEPRQRAESGRSQERKSGGKSSRSSERKSRHRR